MFYVYILQSKKTKGLYIGYSTDLRRRFSEHNSGKSFSTRIGVPWELIYYEAYRSRKDAETREKRLKYFGRALAQLKGRIKASFLEV